MARGGHTVLKELDLTIRMGEHVAILGPNGSGKSSLIRLFTRQDYPIPQGDDHPSMRILGRERWDVADLRSHLGIVSADLHRDLTSGYGIGRLTGLEVVESGFFASLGLHGHQHVTEAMRTAAWRALAQTRAEHLAAKRVDALSTGEARRILIARAMAPDPAALLLDEPTSGLDLSSRHHFLGMLRSLVQAGKTLILVTHHVEEILPEMERVIFLKAGRIVADGSSQELLREAPLRSLFQVPIHVAHHGGWHHASTSA